MAATARSDAASSPTGIGSRLWAWLAAAWGTAWGVAPHVLHHAGPLAGAALLAGTGGKLVFFVAGVAVSLPLLRRLHRRYKTWLAPALALALFVLTFAVSTFLIGPALTGPDSPAKPGIQQPSDHASHHTP